MVRERNDPASTLGNARLSLEPLCFPATLQFKAIVAKDLGEQHLH